MVPVLTADTGARAERAEKGLTAEVGDQAAAEAPRSVQAPALAMAAGVAQGASAATEGKEDAVETPSSS